MRRVIRTLPALLLLLSACASVEIAPRNDESGDLNDLAREALSLAERLGAENVLVVFDIDNTLLAMEQGLGSDQWYEWQKELEGNDPCNSAVVGDRLAVQGALYYASAMRPTQPDGPALLRQIQDAGIPAIALTSRGPSFRLHTFRELRRNGYDFRRTALPPKSGLPGEFVPEHGIRPTRYEDGVFQTAGQHKGIMLSDLLERSGAGLPRVILMADDKQENLDAVIETFAPLGVPVLSWRYDREDANVAAFDPELSALQWRALRPALALLQQMMGPDHYALPARTRPEACLEQAEPSPD